MPCLSAAFQISWAVGASRIWRTQHCKRRKNRGRRNVQMPWPRDITSASVRNSNMYFLTYYGKNLHVHIILSSTECQPEKGKVSKYFFGLVYLKKNSVIFLFFGPSAAECGRSRSVFFAGLFSLSVYCAEIIYVIFYSGKSGNGENSRYPVLVK